MHTLLTWSRYTRWGEVPDEDSNDDCHLWTFPEQSVSISAVDIIIRHTPFFNDTKSPLPVILQYNHTEIKIAWGFDWRFQNLDDQWMWQMNDTCVTAFGPVGFWFCDIIVFKSKDQIKMWICDLIVGGASLNIVNLCSRSNSWRDSIVNRKPE